MQSGQQQQIEKLLEDALRAYKNYCDQNYRGVYWESYMNFMCQSPVPEPVKERQDIERRLVAAFNKFPNAKINKTFKRASKRQRLAIIMKALKAAEK